MDTWVVTAPVEAHLRTHAEAARPLESCGYLVGSGRRITRFVATQNLHDEPETRYTVDPLVYLELDDELQASGGADVVVGIFHSHPATAPEPSSTDRAHAQAGWIYAILGFPPEHPGGSLRAWWLEGPDADFEEHDITIED